MGLRVESDDAVLETVGEVDGAVGRDRDVVHAVVDGRREVEALGGCGEIRRLTHAVPLYAGDILDLATVQLEDPVRGLELHAVSVALGVEGDAEGLVQVLGARELDDFDGGERRSGAGEQGEQAGEHAMFIGC